MCINVTSNRTAAPGHMTTKCRIAAGAKTCKTKKIHTTIEIIPSGNQTPAGAPRRLNIQKSCGRSLRGAHSVCAAGDKSTPVNKVRDVRCVERTLLALHAIKAQWQLCVSTLHSLRARNIFTTSSRHRRSRIPQVQTHPPFYNNNRTLHPPRVGGIGVSD